MKTEQIRLKYITNLSGSPVKEFEGEKEYYSTGAVDGTELPETVSYENKPSRANVLVKEKDILIAKMKNTNKTTLISKEMEDNIYSTGFAVLRANNKLIDEYLYYLLSCDEFEQLKNINSFGTTQQAINEFNLKNLVLTYVFDKTEQQKIIDKLNKEVPTIDLTISETEQDIKDLEEYKKAIITEAVTKGLNKTVPTKDSGIDWIGEIPEGWKVIKLKYLGVARNGLTYSPEDQVDENEGYLVMRSSNIQNGKISLEDNVYVNMKIPKNLVLRENDLLICSRNGSRELIGKNALIDKEQAGQTYGAFMCVYRSEYNKFIHYVLNSDLFSYYLGTFLTSTINQLTNANLNSIKIPFTFDVNEQQEIVNYLDKKCAEIDELIKEKKALIEDLKLYKKSLIYEYVTGKKEVK